jgi:protein SCO1/2
MTRASIALVLALAAPAFAGPEPPLDSVFVRERLGAPLPRDVVLRDADGRPFAIGDAFRDGKPVLLVFEYARCPMLCGLVLGGLADSLARLDWRLGRDYRALSVSIDPDETARDARSRQVATLARIGAPPEAWPFLTGEEARVRALASSVGLGYARDEASGEWIHPAVVFVLTPDGRLARTLDGVAPSTLQLKLALFEASRGAIGSPFERVALRCWRWDPRSHAYAVSNVVRATGAVVLATVALGLARLWRRERRT